MALQVDRIIKRISKAKDNKLIWESHLRECYKYALPEKDVFYQSVQGEKKRMHLFDDTAVEALDRYAARMQSELIPPWRNWCLLQAGSQIPKQEVENAEEYLEEATDVFFENLNHSNFNTQAFETFLDVGISTGALIFEEGDGIDSMFNFRAVPAAELMLERTRRGYVDNVWREIKIPLRDVKEIWPRATLSDKMKEKLTLSPETEDTFIEDINE